MRNRHWVPEMGVPDLNLVYASFSKEGEVCCKLNILVQQPALQKRLAVSKLQQNGKDHACQAACKEYSKNGWK